MESVGIHRWAAGVSNSTNITKAACRDITQTNPTILDLCDCVHHIQNTIKDITKLNTFKPVSNLISYCAQKSTNQTSLVH
jgi:hypothetical protein